MSDDWRDEIYRSQLKFRSKLHRITTIETNKLALSNNEDKRIYIDNVNRLARGHHKVQWRIPELKPDKIN